MTIVQHLTKAQLRELEHELRSECERLERSITTRVAAGSAIPANGSAPQVYPQAEGALAAALETRMLDRHQVLVSALRRLEEGTYGVCLACDNPIPYGRLLVMPDTAYCVRCQAGV